MVLLLGNDERDPLFPQAKEAGASVLEEFVAPSEDDNRGQRVVVGQRLMQTVSDIFLRWVRVQGSTGRRGTSTCVSCGTGRGRSRSNRWFHRDERLRRAVRVDQAHARSGTRIAIASNLGSGRAFDLAVCDVARTTRIRTNATHQALLWCWPS